MFRVKDRHWRDRLMTQCFPAHCSYNVAGNAPKFPPATGMWLVDLMQLMKININSNVSFHTASTPRSHGGHITKSNCPNQQTALTHVNYTSYHNCSQTSLAHLWVPRVCPSRGGDFSQRKKHQVHPVRVSLWPRVATSSNTCTLVSQWPTTTHQQQTNEQIKQTTDGKHQCVKPPLWHS